MTTNDMDISNMGRCRICGKPVDLRDQGDELAITEFGEYIPADEGRKAVVDALRSVGTPESHAAADAIEDEGDILAHGDCMDIAVFDVLETASDLTEQDVEAMDNWEWTTKGAEFTAPWSE